MSEHGQTWVNNMSNQGKCEWRIWIYMSKCEKTVVNMYKHEYNIGKHEKTIKQE